jgi:hypothetical protein
MLVEPPVVEWIRIAFSMFALTTSETENSGSLH